MRLAGQCLFNFLDRESYVENVYIYCNNHTFLHGEYASVVVNLFNEWYM